MRYNGPDSRAVVLAEIRADSPRIATDNYRATRNARRESDRRSVLGRLLLRERRGTRKELAHAHAAEESLIDRDTSRFKEIGWR